MILAKKTLTPIEEIKKELQVLKLQITTVNQNFGVIDDTDLIESSIFQLNALNSRYQYLIKQAKLYEEGVV